MGRLLLGLALAGIAHPALACINDDELPTHEQEFRSQYMVVSSQPEKPKRSRQSVNSIFLAGAGTTLLSAAVFAAWIGGRGRS